jgi:hypothetical protein
MKTSSTKSGMAFEFANTSDTQISQFDRFLKNL